jgi:hypothetical protein
MVTLYSRLAIGLFWGGVLFSVLHVVYGYFFNVWSEVAKAIGGFPDAWIHMTKFGETMLFGFLAVACFLGCGAATGLARR